jgi:hypothetical protein
MDISLSILNRNRNAQYELSFNSQSLFAMELLIKKRHPCYHYSFNIHVNLVSTYLRSNGTIIQLSIIIIQWSMLEVCISGLHVILTLTLTSYFWSALTCMKPWCIFNA